MGYPKGNRTPKPQPNISKQTEDVQALTGALGAKAGKEAVTSGKFASMGVITINSRFVSAAPSQAEYNALVQDVHAIALLLNQLGANFTGM